MLCSMPPATRSVVVVLLPILQSSSCVRQDTKSNILSCHATYKNCQNQYPLG